MSASEMAIHPVGLTSLASLKHAIVAVVYVSEGANLSILSALRTVVETATKAHQQQQQQYAIASQSTITHVPSAKFITMFSDPHYNRTSIVIAGGQPAAVAATARELVAAALAALPPLTSHDATHPRIGLVDHVSMAPLYTHEASSASANEGSNAGFNMDDAAAAACQLSNALATDHGLPVMLYGEARPHMGLSPRTLAETRRQTPYFRAKAKNSGLQSDATSKDVSDSSSSNGSPDDDLWSGVTPDLGGPTINPAVGVCCVGAVPLVLNYNVRLTTSDRNIAAACTAAVRTRAAKSNIDGRAAASASQGLPWVEALPLVHAGGHFEVACNLLNPSVSPPARVLDAIEKSLAQQGCGVTVEEAYTIGMQVEEICAKLVEPPPSATQK